MRKALREINKLPLKVLAKHLIARVLQWDREGRGCCLTLLEMHTLARRFRKRMSIETVHDVSGIDCLSGRMLEIARRVANGQLSIER